MFQVQFSSTLVLFLCVLYAPLVFAQNDSLATSGSMSKYVGTEKCIDCHKDQHKSYLATTHSIATRKTNVKLVSEPEPESFVHEHTGHQYDVVHRGEKLIHREVMLDDQGKSRHVTSAEIAYSIGSGAHGKSYLFRDGEFWVQSPLTWFNKTGRWGMSPGYDRPFQLSFRRQVRSGCVFCHVGNVDRLQENPYRFEITETTIGCERCHGPGESHVKKYTANPDVIGGDSLIVNPVDLSRELSEAICQQCHLQAAAKSLVSGKDEWDYRPGLPLTDFRVDYQYRLGDETMKIVGHVEQLHASECYIQTETLTCITCHDPHNTPKASELVQHHRANCLKCHQDQGCKKPEAERVELADNDCAKCHMPKADTNVPHTAFRQHRIAVYNSPNSTKPKVRPGLSPVLSVENLSKDEASRCESIAKAQMFYTDPKNEKFASYAIEAIGSLVQLNQGGKGDSESTAVLAGLADVQRQLEIAASLSKEVLATQPKPTNGRIESTQLLAQLAFKRNDIKEALKHFRALSTYHRDARDMYFLALCENNSGNVDAAIKALEKSVEIDPSQEAAHVALRAIYQAKGMRKESQFHARQAAENKALIQRLQKRAEELRVKR